VLWHAGRCLSYGEGVSYWALSEMVRARLQISEEDPPDVVVQRLRAGLDRWIEDAADREFIAPRLGQLLGLPTQKVLAKEELFSGWRLFFERLSEHLPVLMIVEDLQWADAGLVAFLDHLLEWSAVSSVTSYGFVLVAVAMSSRNGLRSRRGRVRPVFLHRERTEDCSGSQVACICIYFGLGMEIITNKNGTPVYNRCQSRARASRPIGAQPGLRARARCNARQS